MKKILFLIILCASISGVYSQTFSYTGPAVNIPDNDIVNGGWAEINVAGLNPVREVDYVTINISHTWDADLEIVLEYYDNVYILSNRRGGSNNNYINTVFRDGFQSISTGSAPFTGTFAPEELLPKFVDNFNPNGTWRLHVYDWASGDVGTINNWSITFKAPACPTVGYGTLPATMNCNTAAVTLVASDLTVAGGPVYPTMFFEFNIDASVDPTTTDNTISIFEDGVLIYSDVVTLDRLTVYFTGPYASPTSVYSVNVCNTNSTTTWLIYDGNGSILSNGTTTNTCNNGVGSCSPYGTSSWTCTPTNGITGVGDWGAAIFDPSVVGAGTYTITYNWNNQGSGANACSGSAQHTVTVVNPWNAAWTSPGTVCASNGSFSLTPYITGNAGGTWSGSGVSGTTFNPTGLSGNINVTYTVGSGSTCQAVVSHVITVTPLATAEAGNPASICSGSTHTISGASYGGSATSVLWSSSGTGSFTGATTTTPTYTPSAADIAAGSVLLTITASGPCASASDNMTLTINQLDNASFNYSSGTYCQSGTNPTPTIALPGGSFTYSPAGLSINSLTGTINLVASTPDITYTVTYTTIGTCPNTSSSTILISAGFDASFSYAGPYCQSGTNPTPSFTTGSAGTFSSVPPGLNFISTSTGVIDLATSAPNTYTVTNFIAASGGCASASSTNSVTIEQAPVVNAGSNANICEGTVYNLAGTMSGTATSVTWTTSGNGVFSNSTSLTSSYTPGTTDETNGTVTLTVTSNDPAGPCVPAVSSIVLTLFDAPVVDAGNPATICSSDNFATNGTMSGSATSVLWSTSGTGGFDDATLLAAVYTPSLADITAGSVTLTMTSNDPAGPCDAVSDNILVTIFPAPTADAGNNISVCEGSNASLSGIIGGSATSSTWSSTGTGTFANAASLSTTYTPSSSDITLGSVTLFLTTDDPAGSCSPAFDSLILTINPSPVIDSIITADVTTCATPNGTLDVYAHGGTGTLQYAIDGGVVFSGITNYIGLNVNIYNVVVQDSNLCQATGQGTVNTASNIGPNITNVDIVHVTCNGTNTGSLTIHAQDAILYSINGGALGADSVFTGLSAGVYNIVVEDAGSCQDVSQVTINQNPAIQMDSTVINAGCGTIGTVTVLVTGGVSPYIYYWSNDTANHSNFATNLAAGSYTITVTDNAGCQGSIIAVVGSSSGTGNAIISDTNDVSCFGLTDGSATVAMTNGVAPYSYIWSNNPSNNSATASNLAVGTYTVTINDNSSCTAVLTINIGQPLVLDGNVTTTGNTCFGMQNGTALASATGGTSPYTFLWSNNQNTAAVTGLAQGNYSVTITDNNNCKDSVLNVLISESSDINFIATISNPTCSNFNDGNISVHITGGTPPYSYSWSDLQSDSLALNLYAGTYTLTVNDFYGCTDTSSFVLIQPQTMAVTYIATPTSCYDNIDGAINLTVSNGTAPYRFVWSNNKTTEDITGLEGALYTVTITDSLNCSITFQATVPKGQQECFEIPSAFTPNADGSNDKWEFKNMGLYPNISVEVYNRWGALIFKSDNYAQEPWDGKYNGKDVPAGTYVYIIKQDTSKEPVNGTVTIIR